MWAVLPTALANRKRAQCAKMTPLPEKENFLFVVCSVGLSQSGSAWRTGATITNCAGAFWTGFLVWIHAQEGSHLVLPLRLQIQHLIHGLAYRCRSMKSCWVNWLNIFLVNAKIVIGYENLQVLSRASTLAFFFKKKNVISLLWKPLFRPS